LALTKRIVVGLRVGSSTRRVKGVVVQMPTQRV
jgi:hypothetical protein